MAGIVTPLAGRVVTNLLLPGVFWIALGFAILNLICELFVTYHEALGEVYKAAKRTWAASVMEACHW